jgi:hypothetical protein|tara:strand:+ start:101 stop:277 length:177 start_codon:yes stop_codon:yes gene_type:complete
MEYKEILLKLELIEDGLVDAYNTGHEGEINSDSLYYIDCAKDELYSLKSEIKKVMSND